MGEAKRRGTFEERKAAALERNAETTRQRKYEPRLPKPKRSELTAIMAMTLGMNAGWGGSRVLTTQFDERSEVK